MHCLPQAPNFPCVSSRISVNDCMVRDAQVPTIRITARVFPALVRNYTFIS